MAETEGWIKLHRQLILNSLWTDEPFSRGQAWVDLLLLANHKDGYIRVRGIKIPVLRGQVGWSEAKLSERWKWSRTKVRKFILELQKEQQIEQQKNNQTSIITIVNYELYQSKEQQNEQEIEHQKDSKKTAKEQQKDTNKNNKNDKNDKNEKKKESRTFVPPSLQEVIEYCNERNKGVDPERWFNFYQAKGWMVGKNKMKDWKAAVRTWERDKGGSDGNNRTSNTGSDTATYRTESGKFTEYDNI